MKTTLRVINDKNSQKDGVIRGSLKFLMSKVFVGMNSNLAMSQMHNNVFYNSLNTNIAIVWTFIRSLFIIISKDAL